MDLGSQNNNYSNDSFIFRNGTKVNSIKELIIALQKADDNVFYFHVNDNKNDFYEWIKHSMRNPVLAEKIKKLDKESMIDFLTEYDIKTNFENDFNKDKPKIHEPNDFSNWIKDSLHEP